jgi:hypothetical protein
MMRIARLAVPVIILLTLFVGLYTYTAQATLKYRKETGKKCSFCHTAVPQAGDEDKKLNEDGRQFEENGFKLTEEQKRKPD